MGNKEILKKTTATNLLLRLFIGGFLIYMAYEILTSLEGVSRTSLITLVGFSIFFIISGGVIVIHSLYKLIKRQYYDPMADDAGEEAENDDLENESTQNESE